MKDVALCAGRHPSWGQTDENNVSCTDPQVPGMRRGPEMQATKLLLSEENNGPSLRAGVILKVYAADATDSS